MIEWKTPITALLLSLALTALAPAGLAQAPSESSSGALRALLDDFLAGASINDRVTHENFWSEDLIYTSSRGERFGKADILASLDPAPTEQEAMPSYSAAEVQVQDFGDLAVVTFRLLAHQEGDLVDQYFNTGVFRHSDAGWRAVTWQATRIPSEDQ